MPHIVKVPRKARGGRARYAWKVRYRDPERIERARTFARKAEAERFAASIETDIARGEYVNPRAGRVPLREWATDWLQTTRHLKPKTREGYASASTSSRAWAPVPFRR